MSVFLAVSTPLLAFAGALLGVVLNRRAARELEHRSRREEALRNLRWAADHAARDDETRVVLGVQQLVALAASDLLPPEQRVFVDAALTSLVIPAYAGDEG